ncbi:MAG: integrase core domain-containing protein [Chloroflexota bacterium]|nr:integrase core domain-containing protein [Chloroflexota bacterium]
MDLHSFLVRQTIPCCTTRQYLVNGEIFYSLKEVQILTEQWRREYNTIRPHSSLGYRPPAPETIRLKQAVGLT